MNIKSYIKKKQDEKPKFREDRTLCVDCWQPRFNCFCLVIEKFDPKIEFVILIHPLESSRRIATGRMSYLSLKDSHIIRGGQFSDNPQLNALLSEPGFQNIILSPGTEATNLTDLANTKIYKEFPKNKKLRIFVLDGTWSNAGKMFKQTPELHKLKKYFFVPDKPSNIRVRKQPNEKCYCTLEAIHHIIELLGPCKGFDVNSRLHDNLLRPFNWMVEHQIERIKSHVKLENRLWGF